MVASAHGQERGLGGLHHRRQVSQGAAFDALDQLFRVQGARQSQHTAIGSIQPLVELRHGRRGLGLQQLPPAQDRLAVGMAGAAQLQQLLEGHFIGLILALGEFFEHHLPLHLESFRL